MKRVVLEVKQHKCVEPLTRSCATPFSQLLNVYARTGALLYIFSPHSQYLSSATYTVSRRYRLQLCLLRRGRQILKEGLDKDLKREVWRVGGGQGFGEWTGNTEL